MRYLILSILVLGVFTSCGGKDTEKVESVSGYPGLTVGTFVRNLEMSNDREKLVGTTCGRIEQISGSRALLQKWSLTKDEGRWIPCDPDERFAPFWVDFALVNSFSTVEE